MDFSISSTNRCDSFGSKSIFYKMGVPNLGYCKTVVDNLDVQKKRLSNVNNELFLLYC